MVTVFPRLSKRVALSVLSVSLKLEIKRPAGFGNLSHNFTCARGKVRYNSPCIHGELSEWPKELVSKTRVLFKSTEGSNPSLSAKKWHKTAVLRLYAIFLYVLQHTSLLRDFQ